MLTLSTSEGWKAESTLELPSCFQHGTPGLGIQRLLDGDGKSSQKYPVNAWVPQCSILGPTLFRLYIDDLPDDVICNIAIYADDTALYSKCDQASDLWQQLELVSELESGLWDTADWGRTWLVDLDIGKTQLVLLDWCNNTGVNYVKMDESVVEEK